MLGDVRLQLRPGVQIVPRAQWPPAFGGHSAEWTAALSAPGLRITSRLLDEPARRFLELLREPMAVTAAVLRTAKQYGGDPVEILESAVPLLESLLRSQLVTCVDDDAPAAGPPTAAPGTMLHGWEVVAPVHVVADTHVYLVARHGQECVLKVISRDASWEKTALRNEAAVLAQTSHPAVPLLIDGDPGLDEPYLVLQHRAGRHCTSTAADLRRQPMPMSRVSLLALLAQVTRAYAELHERDVIHGDVQPRNILASLDPPEVSILDFGFATRADGTAYGAAAAPHGGVDCYRAPELWAGGGRFHAATLASEQYAIGCLCFELATGTFPFDRTLSAQQFRVAITSTQARTFADAGVRGWPDLETVLRPALAADPANRYASVRELADALAALAQQAAAAEPERPRRPVRAPAVAQTAGELTRKLYPPLASINYGAAGIGYAWYRRAQAEQDGALLASALTWSYTAARLISAPGAFTNSVLGIEADTVGTASLYHSALGVHLAEAIIAYMADEPWRPALGRMLGALDAGVAHLDVTTGRAGQLLACAHALAVLPRDGTAGLRDGGDAALDALWGRDWRLADEIPGCGAAYLGAAHGWAGVLFATFTWCRQRSRDVPARALSLLAELVDQARQTSPGEVWWPRLYPVGGPTSPPWHGWCHGSAGHVLLLCEVSRSLGPEYLKLAAPAGRHAARIPSLNTSLCCGLAGVAYALLALYRSTAAEDWLHQARELTRRGLDRGQPEPLMTNSLYKGPLALSVLNSDLRAPASAVMPMFEAERW
jgi:eukaryotic-like serine/threonine-protein kinase